MNVVCPGCNELIDDGDDFDIGADGDSVHRDCLEYVEAQDDRRRSR